MRSMMKSDLFSFSPVRPLCAVVLLGLLLSGCSNVKESLGMGKRTPDEFAVVARRPLELPPDMSATAPLPTPDPGAARPQEMPARAEARMALFGPSDEPVHGKGGDNYSAGESALLREAGADKAEPSIRGKVDRETAKMLEGDKSFLEGVMVWTKPNPKGTIVDAEKEAERLRANEAAGKPVTAGETPSIQRRSKALLEGIF